MADKIKVLAGDGISKGEKKFGRRGRKSVGVMKHVSLKKELLSVEVVTEENKKKLLGTAAWGTVGFLLLGPLAAIGGMLVGGRKQEVSFVGTLMDGRQFLGVTKPETYQKLVGWTFKNKKK